MRLEGLGFIIFTFQTIAQPSPRAADLFLTPALLPGTWCRFARVRLFVTFQVKPKSNRKFRPDWPEDGDASAEI